MSRNAKLFNKDHKDYGVSSPYGNRNLVVDGKQLSRYHIGTDYLFPQGTELVLPVEVEILKDTGHSDYGGQVFAYSKELDGTFHPAHITELYVKKGDVVPAGTVIGLSGGRRGTPGAGTSTGPHLHIGYYAKGKKTDTYQGTQGDGGWVDIELQDFTTTPTPTDGKFHKGDKVRVTADKYVTGQTVPSSVKSKDHTVKLGEDNKDRPGSVLLDEINSWVSPDGLVKVSDHKPSPTPTPTPNVFKPYEVTLPSGTPLYREDGTRFTIDIKNPVVVTIIKENRNLNQGLFRADWLIGVNEAWVKLSGNTVVNPTKSTPVSNVGKTAQLRGSKSRPVKLYSSATNPIPFGGGKWESNEWGSKDLKIVGESGNRVQVISTKYSPNKVWVDKSSIKIV